ncbi:substance-K receptor-like protein [Leptotrombidium deliense]|uniref:Substance-K receptor-like protein n=1 Tax=Leptotrombidium deliense TaxID=299467 RepID=A0A443RZA5_9ACAR|nr:substance-K receptor-like protein [Leptotrombidium deliense]
MGNYEFNLTTNTFSDQRKLEDNYKMDAANIAYLIGVISIGLVSLVGNGTTVKIMLSKKRIRSSVYYLIANMALSDALFGLLIINQFFVCATYFSNHFGSNTCNMLHGMFVITRYVSAFTMTAIAWDRYQGIEKSFDENFVYLGDFGELAFSSYVHYSYL